MTPPQAPSPSANEHDRIHAGHQKHEGHQGHDQHAGHSVEMFRDKFWWSVALTVPTVVWSPMIQQWLRFQAPTFPGSRYIPAIFGTILFFYGGMVFLRGAVREIKDRLPGMMTLISLAIVVAFGFSLAVTLGVPGMDLWWELSTLITIMILGHWIEMRSISQAQGRAQGAGEAGARYRRAVGRRQAGRGAGVGSPRRRRDSGPSGLEHPRRWCRPRGKQRGERGHDHRRVPARRQEARGQGDRGHRERLRLAPCQGDGRGRTYCTRRHYAAGRASSKLPLEGAGTR